MTPEAERVGRAPILPGGMRVHELHLRENKLAIDPVISKHPRPRRVS